MDCFASLAMTEVAVARMERSVIGGPVFVEAAVPDCASLHPGYDSANKVVIPANVGIQETPETTESGMDVLGTASPSKISQKPRCI
jgi:hypothetical protein